MTVEILAPGIFRDLPEDQYHSDPVPESSLSYSGAKEILKSPAHYRWTRENRVEKKAFDYGRAAHAVVLGAGAGFVEIPAEILATNGAASTTKAKEFIAEARANGLAPLKADEVAIIHAMAAKLREHPVASKLLDPDQGEAEVSAFWRDPDTKIMLRARFDWLTRLPTGRPCIVDYKSTGQSADPRRWGREAGNLGYFIQDPWYRDGHDALHPGEQAAFLFVVQEKEAPFHVSVCELDDDARAAGADEAAHARAIYLDCMTTGQWPSYPPSIHRVSIPHYLTPRSLTMTDQPQQPGTDLALPSESAPPTLGQRITSMEHHFAMAAPRGFEARQLVRDAMTALSQTPKLMECEQRSVLGALMTMAQLGLRVGVLGHGWVLPFWDSRFQWVDEQGRKRTGAFRAQLIVGYKGYVALAHRSGQIASISARTVHENDHFEVEYGVDEKLVHRPSKGDRGKPIGYYAVVRFANGGNSFWHMSRDEAEHHRDRYAMAKKKDGTIVGPWRDNFDEMAQKTCVRALAKFMPQNTDLATALAVDDTVRVDITPEADPVHVSEHIEPGETLHTPSATDDFPVEEPPAGGEA